MNATLPLSEILEPRCARCDGELAVSLKALPGIREARVEPEAEAMTVEFDEAAWTRDRLQREARELARSIAGRTRHLTLYVGGMDCPGCAVGIGKAAQRVPGVSWAGVNFATGRLLVEGDEGAAARVEAEVRGLGYHVGRAPATSGETAPAPARFSLLATRPGLLALAGGLPLAAAFALQWSGRVPAATACFVASLLITGVPTLLRGVRIAASSRTLDMFFLMAVACGGAAAIGDWSEGATALFLFTLGNALEAFTFGRTRDAIRGLVSLAPREATVRHGDHEEKVPVAELKPGAIVLVRPGERLPADGEVVHGDSFVNEAMITGESAPAEKHPGSPVFAGTLNDRGALEIRVSRAVADATLNRIVDLVERAQARRAPSQRFIDRFAAVYTPVVLLMAAGVAVVPPLLLAQPWHTWIERALTLLVISCPCALVISTPVSILSAIATASRNGILLKGGAALEALGRVRAVAFDKTGTLTEGRFEVTEVAAWGIDEAELLRRAAVAALAGEHPLSKAVVARAHGDEIRPGRARVYESIPGMGARVEIDGEEHWFGSLRLLRERGLPPGEAPAAVEKFEAEGRTCAVLATRAGPAGILAFSDRVRDGAAAALRDLHDAGIRRTVLLTGDSEPAARAVAARLGIDDVRAGLLPEAKVAAVEDIRRTHPLLAMVGDGVNDAPALAAATVGIAMGAAGSDAALETADVALMSDDLRRIPLAVRLGRRASRVIAQNVVTALAFKAAFLALAVAGLANLWMAVAADVGVSLLVTLNGMRLLQSRHR
ncbi:MAG: cation-translocating P-type ATPase [Planctomycetes bacterium]|nr:cation-translocating P-type ATPase [Planctomycetota bacterium]